MSISYCGGVPVKEQIEDKEMRNMRKLFNGEATVDIDGKSIKIGDTITRSYGKTTGASDPSMAERLFKEIVVNETYKHAIDEYVGFTEGDYRRIRNRIIKESKKLGNPKLGILEKLFFVKRGVMGKFAVTNWMNKNINLVTNYERTKYGEYLRGNIRISRLLRAEALKRGQPRWIPGIKNEKDLRKLENKLIREMSNPESEINFDKVNKIKRKILGVLGEQGDGVMADLRDYLQTPKEEIYEVLREKPDKFSKNIVEAGEITRKLLDSMGHVLIKGLRSFKETQSLAYLNVPNTKVGTIGAAVNAKLAKKLQRNFLKIDEEIKAIEEGMKDGNYFPHYLTGAFVKLEGIMDKALASKDPAKRAGEYMDEIENVFRNMRNNTGVPSSAKFKGTEEFDNYMQNPLSVIRKYSMDAITFNRVNHIRSIYLKGMKKLPKDAETSEALRKYLSDIFTLAEKGYQSRKPWVNKMVRVLTGFEFFSKIGMGVATAARNTMSGLFYVQGVGNRAFVEYLIEWKKMDKDVVKAVHEIEEEQGFKFEDLASPLFTEGLLPTKGIGGREIGDVDIKIGADGNAKLHYKEGKVWKGIDSSVNWATGKASVFQRVTENILRQHMFRFSFIRSYNDYLKNIVKSGDEKVQKNQRNKAISFAKQHALDMVNKYAFEYAAHQKAPIAGGTSKDLGAIGNVAFQFMHYPMSFLQLQSEILKNSKDAVIAKQWNSPDLFVPLRFAGLYLFTSLMSGVWNVDFHRLMENDTIERIKDIKKVVIDGEEDVKGRGFTGPAIGDLFFLASLNNWIETPDHVLAKMLVGYNDAYEMTDKQKKSRLLSVFNVEMSKWTTKNWKSLENGNIWNVMMNEFGLYPKAWTREMRQKFPLNLAFDKPTSKKTGKKGKSEEAVRKEELNKLYESMGSYFQK